MRGEVRAGRREGFRRGGRRKWHARRGTDSRLGVQGTRGAHVEHEVHASDLRRVEAQRLVERQRVLPSRKEGMRCGARCEPREAEGRGAVAAEAACTERDRLKAWGPEGTG
jgi:hypothetical protein